MFFSHEGIISQEDVISHEGIFSHEFHELALDWCKFVKFVAEKDLLVAEKKNF